ncbi:uncharacterized protein LOC120334406 isoform X2 [Styela clava]
MDNRDSEELVPICFPTIPNIDLDSVFRIKNVLGVKAEEAKTFFSDFFASNLENNGNMSNPEAGQRGMEEGETSAETDRENQDNSRKGSAEGTKSTMWPFLNKVTETFQKFQRHCESGNENEVPFTCLPRFVSETKKQHDSKQDDALNGQVSPNHETRVKLDEMKIEEINGKDGLFAAPDEFNSVRRRIHTFGNSMFGDPEVQRTLASSGFYSLGGQSIQCIGCRILHDNWDLENDPTDSLWHRRGCRFLLPTARNSGQPNGQNHLGRSCSFSTADLGAVGGEQGTSHRATRVFSEPNRVRRSATCGDLPLRQDAPHELILPHGIERVTSDHSFELFRKCGNCGQDLLGDEKEVCRQCRKWICSRPNCQQHGQCYIGRASSTERRSNDRDRT